jgi:UDP:flavonoid glycosyltransferase YjiC (YdhE family)
MQPVPHPSATRRFGPPESWDEARDGPCATIHIADATCPTSGAAVMESLYRPDDEELAALNAGGKIILGIFGTVHPVVYLAVTVPPQKDVG